MLKRLSVENYILIDKLELEFGKFLNIITGETGAGKSILLGALGLLLGNRSDSAAIRDLSRNCVVEGEFEISAYGLENFFSDNDLDYEPSTVIRRVLSAGGKSRCYINDLPVPQTVLREFGSSLIDIHSQHQSLLIAEDGFRISLLDSVAGHKELNEEYASVFRSLKNAEREVGELRDRAEDSRRDEEWIRHQLGELSSAALREGEQEELEAGYAELEHAVEIQSCLGSASELLAQDETGVLDILNGMEKQLRQMMPFYARAGEFVSRLDTAIVELRELQRELNSEALRVEADPERLRNAADRLDRIYSLQQKHRVQSITELIAIQQEYTERLGNINRSDEEILRLEEEIRAFTRRAVDLARKITGNRMKAASEINRHVIKVLDALGIPSAVFQVEVTPSGALKASGADNVRLLFSANRNVPPAPVEKAASGGEISRVMLALKSLAVRNGKLPTIIFDEIDTGVSGRIADAMGNIIESLAGSLQVINITHLPQVASKGDHHFVVYKDHSGDAPRTLIRGLSPDERVDEIAKMLSGSTVTDAARTQAKVLLGV